MNEPHDPRHPDVSYDPDEHIRLGTVIDALHLLDSRGSDEHPADLILRLVATTGSNRGEGPDGR